MDDAINKPIFVVGSPRSGTSILTWCLGQHPNIIPLEESNWMGELATNLGIYHQIGTARGDYSLLSSMDVEKSEFFAAFGSTINDLILRHHINLERKRWRHTAGPGILEDDFATEFRAKRRWVDGTPENSFYICGLRKLFPEAQFIHIFRDVTSVVRSMLHFERVSGTKLVANEQEAFSYWLNTVNNCLLAERAYGARVIFRLRYSDLVDSPEAALLSLFDFLGEPYKLACLKPLAQRINSSNVPADFEIDIRKTDPSLLEEAAHLCHQVEEKWQPLEASGDAVKQIEDAFDKRVQFVATLDSEYLKAQQEIARLQDENAKSMKRAARLAKELEGKKSIIQHLRARRKPSNWLHALFGALRKTFQPRSTKTHAREMGAPGSLPHEY